MAHTERLEQQYQAQVQLTASQHATDMKQRTASLVSEHQQQLKLQADQQSSKRDAHAVHMAQLLEQAQALLAAEKQRTAALKVKMEHNSHFLRDMRLSIKQWTLLCNSPVIVHSRMPCCQAKQWRSTMANEHSQHTQ